MAVFSWIENTAFSTWTRESSWALFAFLIVHTIAMGLVVGIAIAMNLRILGAAKSIPLSKFRGFVALIPKVLVVIVASGLLLLVSYPTKALTNPLFYVKLTILVCALLLTRALARRLFADGRYDSGPLPGGTRALAGVCLTLWCLGLTAGKFLAYTHHLLLAP